jgi:hypothetical protein
VPAHVARKNSRIKFLKAVGATVSDALLMTAYGF